MTAYFDGGYFNDYFTTDSTAPTPEPPVYYGTRARWRRTDEVMREWRIRQDDEEFFLIE